MSAGLSPSTTNQEVMFWPIEGGIFAATLNISTPAELADTFVKPVNFTRVSLLACAKEIELSLYYSSWITLEWDGDNLGVKILFFVLFRFDDTNV